MLYNPVAFKERDVRRAVRAASKEGLIVGVVEIEPDGTIRVMTTPPDNAIDPTRPSPSGGVVA